MQHLTKKGSRPPKLLKPMFINPSRNNAFYFRPTESVRLELVTLHS